MANSSKTPFPVSMTLLVLALLEEGDQYGYQIICALEARSDYTFSMNEGTLYPILHGLERDGEVCSYHAETDNGRRKYYRLTKQGIHTLSRKRKEWDKFCARMGKIVGGEACAKF